MTRVHLLNAVGHTLPNSKNCMPCGLTPAAIPAAAKVGCRLPTSKEITTSHKRTTVQPAAHTLARPTRAAMRTQLEGLRCVSQEPNTPVLAAPGLLLQLPPLLLLQRKLLC